MRLPSRKFFGFGTFGVYGSGLTRCVVCMTVLDFGLWLEFWGAVESPGHCKSHEKPIYQAAGHLNARAAV